MEANTHTFKINATVEGHFAVFVYGLRIADHQEKADALAHCDRLRRQVAE
jgi:hypothetical protein